MKVSAWNNGKGIYGVNIGKSNREQYFDSSWENIKVEIDGKLNTFTLTAGFWNKCAEFRDGGSSVLQDWLRKHHSIHWEKGKPPHFQLVPLGDNRFKLIP